MRPIQDSVVLVVEDEYLIADDLCYALEEAGARVLGPAPSVREALELIRAGAKPDAAILDINLRGENAFPIADRLRELNIPFVFATGYEAWAIPADYRGVYRCEKPVRLDVAVRELFTAS